ncbi:AMP-binding protein [Streptomyces sp. Ac-502]|uniref:AMP-binding protein n=1 Tax=Streptomyces sp. Ac-502 TaxID=3342801 RepID=UPI0038626730
MAVMDRTPHHGDVLALCLGTPPAARLPEPGRTALRDASGAVTYGELCERVRYRGTELRARGLGPGSLVPLSTERSVATIVELLALLAAEVAFVPLADGAGGGPGTRRILRGAAVLPPDAAYVMTTSGSTGAPKEPVVTRTGLRHVFGSLRTALAPHVPSGLRWTQFHPLTFGYTMCEVLGSLALGGELDIVPRERPLTCTALHDGLADDDAGQVLCLTPSELTLLTQRLQESGACAPTHVILSGEPAHRTQLADFFALPGAEHTYMVNTYAATETAGQVTVSRITAADVEAAMNGYVGHPLPGVEVTLRGPDGRTVPCADTAATGEIWVSGPTVAAGYLDAEQTAARFTAPSPDGGPRPSAPATSAAGGRTADCTSWDAEDAGSRWPDAGWHSTWWSGNCLPPGTSRRSPRPPAHSNWTARHRRSA